VSDLVKIRQHGFGEAVDSEEMFRRVLMRLRELRVIP